MIRLNLMMMFKLKDKIRGKFDSKSLNDCRKFDFHLFNIDRFIIWRKANKVLMRLNVTPSSDLKVDEDVITGFTMQFTYSNAHTSTPEKDSQPHRHALSVRVYVNAGKIAA